MKILMISPQPFFEPRGTPISVFQRLEALSALGHEIDLVTYHLGKDVEFPRVKIHRVRRVSFIKHVRVGPSRAKILLDVLVLLKAVQMLLQKRYDVIHSHEEASFFSMILAWVSRTRHLYDMHSVLSTQLSKSDFGRQSVFVKLFGLLEKLVLKSCTAVITVAPDLEAFAKAVNPGIRAVTIENNALQVYGSPVSPEKVEQLKASLNLNGKIPIVYTGTYEHYQGLDMVLECIHQVVKIFPDTIFLFVGAKNTQASDWSEKVKAMGLSDYARFLDVVPPEESMVYLAYAALLISPRLEGLSTPLKIYSYLHSGKPIVATNITAHTQVLTSDIAVLVDPNKDAFAEGIVRLLCDPELAAYLGRNAHQFALENFNYQAYLGKVGGIYQILSSTSVSGKLVLTQK